MRENTIAASVGLRPEADGQASLPFRLTGSQKKTAFALRQNVESLIAGNAKKTLRAFTDDAGQVFRHWVADAPENLNCVGFLTLTVGGYGADGKFQQVFDAAEASRRINNLNRRVLPDLFEKAIVVTERHKNGAIHFHVVGILRGRPDVRSGINWDEIGRAHEMEKRGVRPPLWLYRSASADLRDIWASLRASLPRYGFGRAHLLPIRKTGEAIACYVSKYIEKNICNRLRDDARKKLVRYIGWEKKQLRPNDFGWATAGAVAWRWKTRHAAALVNVDEPEQAAETFGPRWSFHMTGIWRKVDGSSAPFLVADLAERELIRRELSRVAGRHQVRKNHERTRNRFEIAGLSYDVSDFREYWESWPSMSETAYKSIMFRRPVKVPRWPVRHSGAFFRVRCGIKY